MKAVIFKTSIFRTLSPKDIERGELALGLYLNTLFQLDKAYLQDYPSTPGLYQSGVRYKREPSRGRLRVGGDSPISGIEVWKDVCEVLKDGHGDCEDLACWRAAELYVRAKIDARPVWSVQNLSDTRLYHIRVKYPDGRIEDPSKTLGME